VRRHGPNRRLPALVASLAIALTVYACGGEDLPCNGPFCVSPPERPEPAALQAGDNNGQQGAPGRELPAPIDVKVTDSEGRPVSDVTVNFTVSSGSGSLSNPSAESNSDGLAQVNWRLGGEIGTQRVQATATNSDGAQLANSPLELSAEAVLPQPARLVLRTAPPEIAQNGVRFEQQPVIEVLDADDQPVPQVEVVASVLSGGAGLSGTTAAASDADGQASFADLALIGPQGAQTLRFSVIAPALEVTSSPVQLVAGTAATLSGVEPLAYEGTIRSPVTPGPSVIVKDEAGNGVPGVSVAFTPNRDASVSPETAITNEQGVAQVSWILGSTANVQYLLTARIESSPAASVRFTATARPGAAGRLRVAVQPSSPTQSGTPFAQQPVIQVVDQAGNPALQPGVTVTATVSSGPTGSLQNATATTDASGQAAFSGLALTGAVGNYTLSFSAPGLAGVNSAPLALTVGAAARLAFTVSPSTGARSRMPLVIQPVLQIQDPSGNPIRQAGVQVVATSATAGTTVTGETATTDANGRAAFTLLTLTGTPGPKDITFSAPGLQSVSARVTLPSVATVSAAPTHPVSAPVATTVSGPVITWTLRDGSTRPVADADFTLVLPSGGTAATLTPLSDANGAVQVGDWTLGPAAGYQYLVLRLPDGREFRDSILATPGPAFDLLQVSGDAQTAPVNSELPERLVVRVVDQYNNGVPDVPVQWATCDGVLGPVVNTDVNGYSAVTQPTGTQPSGDEGFPFCTRASIAQPPDAIEFHYRVTAVSSQEGQPQGISGAESRHSGPPPVAPRRFR
jgi:adhesin/invasin